MHFGAVCGRLVVVLVPPPRGVVCFHVGRRRASPRGHGGQREVTAVRDADIRFHHRWIGGGRHDPHRPVPQIDNGDVLAAVGTRRPSSGPADVVGTNPIVLGRPAADQYVVGAGVVTPLQPRPTVRGRRQPPGTARADPAAGAAASTGGPAKASSGYDTNPRRVPFAAPCPPGSRVPVRHSRRVPSPTFPPL